MKLVVVYLYKIFTELSAFFCRLKWCKLSQDAILCNTRIAHLAVSHTKSSPI